MAQPHQRQAEYNGAGVAPIQQKEKYSPEQPRQRSARIRERSDQCKHNEGRTKIARVLRKEKRSDERVTEVLVCLEEFDKSTMPRQIGRPPVARMYLQQFGGRDELGHAEGEREDSDHRRDDEWPDT